MSHAKKKNVKSTTEVLPNTEKQKNNFSVLVGLVFVAIVLRSVLAIAFRNGPTVIIDESLYTNIARSLFNAGKLEYRGQPINYPYLFYPILLTPIYGLQRLLGGDIYRYIQVYNAVLINSSAIPLYLFTQKFTGNSQKALAVSILTLIIPDMIFGEFMMVESVLWPLALWLVYFSYGMFAVPNSKYAYCSAVITALMYFTKPGAIVMGLTIMIAVLLIQLKSRQKCTNILISFAVLTAFIGLMYLLYHKLYPAQSSVIGLYEKQTEEWKPRDILVASEAIVVMTFMFCAACGGIFAVLPFAYFKHYSREQRLFVLTITLGVLGIIIGTAFFVVPYKWDGSLGNIPAHMRYYSMFIPVYLAFSIEVDVPESKANHNLYIYLMAFAALMIFPGVRIGFVRGHSGHIDSATLAAFMSNQHYNGVFWGNILTVITVLFTLFLCISSDGGWTSKKHTKYTFIFLSLFFLCNTAAEYKQTNIYLDNSKELSLSVVEDAREINDVLEVSDSALCVTQRFYDDIYSYWLESRLNKPLQHVTIDQMFVTMSETGGVYHPFTPLDQVPNVGCHDTVDTTTIILGKTIAEHLEVSNTVDLRMTANNQFAVAHITENQRWIDTIMYGMDDNRLPCDRTGYIMVYDENRNDNGMLTLHITAYGNGSLKVGDTLVQLTSDIQTYDVVTDYSKQISVSAVDTDAYILSYVTDAIA